MVCVSRGAVTRIVSLLFPGRTTHTSVKVTSRSPSVTWKLDFWGASFRAVNWSSSQTAVAAAPGEAQCPLRVVQGDRFVDHGVRKPVGPAGVEERRPGGGLHCRSGRRHREEDAGCDEDDQSCAKGRRLSSSTVDRGPPKLKVKTRKTWLDTVERLAALTLATLILLTRPVSIAVLPYKNLAKTSSHRSLSMKLCSATEQSARHLSHPFWGENLYHSTYIITKLGLKLC